MIFPNTFEYFFIFYELVRTRWDPRSRSLRWWVVAAAAIWVTGLFFSCSWASFMLTVSQSCELKDILLPSFHQAKRIVAWVISISSVPFSR